MRVIARTHGGPDVLDIVEEAPCEPGQGEVRIRVQAAGVGYPDLLMREGTYPGGPKPPFTPGYDLVGEVEVLGEGVSGITVGQRVAALTVYGAYTDWICLPVGDLVDVPPDLDAAEAVGLVLNYVTAYQLMYRAGRMRRGQRLLVHGAAGGVGSAAVQLGALDELEMYGTASAKDLPLVEEMGATAVDRRGEDFVEVLRRAGGSDVVLDGIGGTTSLRSLRALVPGGRLVLFGHYATLRGGRRSAKAVASFYAAGALTFAWGALWPRRHVISYQVAKEMGRHFDRFSQDLRRLFSLLQEGKIKPLIADRLPLEQAAKAHERLGAGGVSGKLVLMTDAPRD